MRLCLRSCVYCAVWGWTSCVWLYTNVHITKHLTVMSRLFLRCAQNIIQRRSSYNWVVHAAMRTSLESSHMCCTTWQDTPETLHHCVHQESTRGTRDLHIRLQYEHPCLPQRGHQFNAASHSTTLPSSHLSTRYQQSTTPTWAVH